MYCSIAMPNIKKKEPLVIIPRSRVQKMPNKNKDSSTKITDSITSEKWYAQKN